MPLSFGGNEAAESKSGSGKCAKPKSVGSLWSEQLNTNDLLKMKKIPRFCGGGAMEVRWRNSRRQTHKWKRI
jgi:hypothetical protein